MRRGLVGLLTMATMASGCDAPKRSPNRRGLVLGVPYIDTDPLPEPPPRAALAAADWLPLSTGGDRSPDPVTKPHLAVVGDRVETYGGDLAPKIIVALRRLAFGRLPPPPDAVDVDAAALAALGFDPPAPHVWIFGPEGPCRARVTTPMVGRYDGPAGEVLEVSWRLEGCLGRAWAPIGALVEMLPPDLKWVVATPVLAAEVDPRGGWTHPLAAFSAEPEDSGEPPAAHAVTVLEVLGARPAPVEVLYAHLRPDPEAPGDPCRTDASVRATHGWWDGQVLKPFEPVLDPFDVPVLLGAILQDDATEALLYANGPDTLVAVPPTPPAPEPENAPEEMAEREWGPPTWTHIVLPTDRVAGPELATNGSIVEPRCAE